MTTDERAQQLLDLEAIKQLKARYTRLVDWKRWDEWRALFTDDARYVDLRVSGASADEFVANVRSMLENGISVHVAHNPEIAFTGTDSARGIWGVADYIEYSRGGIQWGFRGYGHYEEEYRREPDGWKIAMIRIARLRVDVIPGRQFPSLPLPDHVSDWLDVADGSVGGARSPVAAGG